MLKNFEVEQHSIPKNCSHIAKFFPCIIKKAPILYEILPIMYKIIKSRQDKQLEYDIIFWVCVFCFFFLEKMLNFDRRLQVLCIVKFFLEKFHFTNPFNLKNNVINNKKKKVRFLHLNFLGMQNCLKKK